MKLKLMTYNIWGGRHYAEHLSGKREADCTRNAIFAAEVIKKEQPDIVSLNEVYSSVQDGYQTEQIAAYAGYEYYFFAPALSRTGRNYGNAILSKYPIKHLKMRLVDEEAGVRLAETRSVLCATLDCNGHALDVIVSHFGLIESEKERATDAVLSFANESHHNCVFMGDLNSTLDSVHVRRLCNFFRISNDGQEEIKTWPVEHQPPELRTYVSPLLDRQIDYIFVSNGVSVNKTAAVYSLASDHKALFAEVEV